MMIFRIASTNCVGACPSGYLEKKGNIPGWGSYLGSGLELTRNECAERCNVENFCLSFEHSSSEKRCNLNEFGEPTVEPYKDYVFCTKQGNIMITFQKSITYYMKNNPKTLYLISYVVIELC